MQNRKKALSVSLLIISFFSIYYLFQDSDSSTDLPTNLHYAARINSNPLQNQISYRSERNLKIHESYSELPLHFEPNLGQTDERVKFLVRGQGYALFLTGREAVLSVQKHGKSRSEDRRAVVKMSFDGGNDSPKSAGLDVAESKSNYFIGSDPEKWQTNVPNFEKVKYESIYDGIDLVYYGNNQQLEYDFSVQPNGDPNQIKLKFEGIKTAKIDEKSGDVLLETEVGAIRQHAPIVYQNIDGERREIASTYSIQNSRDKSFLVSFDLSDYDRSKELIIDPILSYGSYLGGNGFDEGRGIAVDAAGNAYVVGTASSRDFPTTPGTIKPVLLPRTDAPNSYWYDAFVTKINPAGTAIVFSTYFGGREGNETGSGVAVDAGGNVLITGTTMASDFPTVNAYQTTFGGTDDAFAAKLNSTGSAIIYSTFLGGNNTDSGGKIALNHTTGDAVFAGYASSPNFPTTTGAYKQKLCDTPQSCNGIFYSGSYIVKLSANGGAVYSTLFDATINDITLDANDNAVFGGSVSGSNFPATPGAFQTTTSGGIEGFIAKLNRSGSALLYGTYLGGGLQSDRVKSIALDSAQNIYVTGQTENAGFPTTAGVFDQTFNGGEDGFLTKFNPAGSALIYSTFFGGTARDEPFAIGLGTDNSAFVAGETLSGANFPLRNSLNGNNGTIFVTRFNPNASALVFSTLLGIGGGYDIAVDGANNAYITGHTLGILVTPDAFQTVLNRNPDLVSIKDAYIVKLAPTDENATFYSISGTVTDQNYGYNHNYKPIVVTVTGTINRSVNLPYSGGQFNLGVLPAGGNYTVTARKIGYVTAPESVSFNNLGANQSVDFTIIRNQEPEGVITSPIYGATYDAPATITIQATASDPDGDAISKVDFAAYNSALGSIPLGTDTTAPYEFTWNNVPVGTWALYAFPTDSNGLLGVSTEIIHVFVVDSTGLSVAITSPAEGQTFSEGEYVPLSADVSSSVTILEFYDQDNNLVGRRTSAPWSTNWRVMDTGNYTLTAKVLNSQGLSITSAAVNITVNQMNHRIAGQIYDFTLNAPVSNITLNLTSPSNPNVTATTISDSNGDYLFTDLGATLNDSVTITPVSANYTFDPQIRNIGYLGYIHRENENFSATRITQISVAMTSPTDGQIFTAPATINLAADASSGAGSITKVEFYQRRGAVVTLLATDTTAPYEHQATNVPANIYGYFARATDSTGAVKDSVEVGVTVNPPVTSIRLQGDITNPSGGWMQGITVRLTGTANGNPINQTDVSNYFGAYGFFNLPAGGDYTITPEAPTRTFTPPSFSVTNATQDNLDIDFVASAPNQSPSVQINSPADGAIFTMPVAIPVNATATDTDGSIVHLALSAVGNSITTTIGQSNNGTFNAPWQPNLPGNYILWATARDNGGLSTSVSIQITVNRPAPVTVSGRIVDRNSAGIEAVSIELKDFQETSVIATATTDVNGNYAIPNIVTFESYVLRASKQDYTFSPQKRTYFNLSTNQTTADFTGTLQVQPSDFDGDSRSDIAVWRPSTGVWHIQRSNDDSYTSMQFGGSAFGDIAVPGNYDGDKKTDYAVYRGGAWYIWQSSNGKVRIAQFGLANDKPVAGDYDGDGKTDLAVWRPSEGVWYIWRSSGGFDFRQFGLNGDVPLSGDFDGDGKTDLTIWRPSSGIWYVWKSSDGNYGYYQFGLNGDVPLIGDFDGDKLSDYTIFRPSTGVWFVNLSSDGSFKILQWGISTDIPVPGDYDKDGKTDFGVFRPSEGNWYIFKSSTNSYVVQHFGANGDIPIPAAYR